MCKVGILTMQRIANYGSFLQAYGLKRMLEELGCNVEFVDYHPGETLVPANGGKGIARKISKLTEVFKYDAPLKDKILFIKYKKNYPAMYYPYLGIDNLVNYYPKLDLLVIGSDEVFNCVQNNSNVGFSPELFGEGNNARVLVSYAASFGNTTMQKLKQYKVDDIVGNWLEKFDFISVRDVNSGSVVETLLNKKPEFHFDPVLVYDFVGKCQAVSASIPDDKYMILYGYSGRFSEDECKVVRDYAKKEGLKVFCIGGVQNCCDKFIDCSPFQVISYFQYADCVVTDTFHGTVLSVITHRQFVSVVRSNGYGNSEKIIDLLSRLKLKDRITQVTKAFSEIVRIPIDYDGVDKIIRMERERSYNYLSSCIRLID